MSKKGIPHRKFSKEEKMKYIRLHLDEHMPLRQIERECGIRNTLVAEWVKRYYKTEKTPWNRTTEILTLRFIAAKIYQKWNVCVCWYGFYPIHMLLLSLALLLMQ